MADTLNLVSVNNQLAVDVKRTEIKSLVIERITKLGLNTQAYRGSVEHLLLLCNLVEHLTNTKKHKVNKKELVLDILHQLFILNPVERLSIEANIDFLHANSNIKKLSHWKLFCAGVKEYFGLKKK